MERIEENDFKRRKGLREIVNFISGFSIRTKMILIVFLLVVVCIVMFSLGLVISPSSEGQTKTVKLGFEDVGKLVTQSCHTTVVRDSKENREFFKLFDIPFTESRQIFSYDYRVDAALDFDKLKIKKISDSKKEIIVVIPHTEIYGTIEKKDSLKVFLDEESLFSRIDLSEQDKARSEMEKQAENDCVANGLLDEADSNAKKIISGFLKTNYEDYKVIFEYKDGE